jgi:Fe-S cluster assembly protein SufD
MSKQTALVDPFAGDLAAPGLPGADLPWRATALESYRRHGLPNRKVEAWRYTNLNSLAKLAFTAAGKSGAAVPRGAPLALDGACRITFVNGHLRDMDGLPDGVEATSLAELLANDPESLESVLGAAAEGREMALAALNTALAADGLVLRIAEGAKVETPIHMICVGAPEAGSAIAFHPRNIIVAGANSNAVLVESHVGAGDGPYFSNGVSDVSVGQGAVFGHYRLQDEGASAFHVSLTRAALADGATYDSFVLSLGAELARDEIHVRINGEGAECRLNGAYAATGRQHTDNTTVIDHAAPGSTSREVYMGVLDGKSRGVFQGRISVHRDAQQTNGHQLNKTLLLSREAEIDSKPELEIFADDVKCSHGATVGELDEAALFYLRARGIDQTTARDLLVSAFLSGAIEEVRNDAVAEALRGRIAGWLDAMRANREAAK